MESIFHEKQEGSLCAQHCLNNLLQGEYFSPVELSSIAQQLDEEERMRMAEGGVQTEEYRTFLQQPSGNMDDSGFFSIRRPKLIGEDEAQRVSVQQVSEPGHTADEVLLDEDEEELRKALALSRRGVEVEDEEADLRRAIQLSMLGGSDPSGAVTAGSSHESGSSEEAVLTAEELRRRRQVYFDRQQAQHSSSAGGEKDSGTKPSQ
ncbi:ataxin-3 [Cyprinus carpio]|uniref:ubiquitinyl hydrolase 1 n=1 Tax=Cyprinus carpio TaxID=7962 RepID=A0A9Q9Z336_CYPCA|nr:ataxin-3 [Cyprinus carpio]